MKLISISGLDGSGKSTQVEMLKKYLKAQGKRVFYFHAVEFGIGNRIARFLKRLYYILLRPERNITSQKSITKVGRLGIWSRKIALKIDLMRFKNLADKLEKQGFDYIVSDRYFYDTVINITYLLENTGAKLLPRQELSSWKIPKPDLAVYLQTDPEIIMQRERTPDQGIEYLKKKMELYSNTSNNWNLVTIDGNKSREEVFEEIANKL